MNEEEEGEGKVVIQKSLLKNKIDSEHETLNKG